MHTLQHASFPQRSGAPGEALPDPDAVGVPPNQKRSHPEALEVIGFERRVLIRSRKLVEGITPSLALEGFPAALDRSAHAQSLADMRGAAVSSNQ